MATSRPLFFSAKRIFQTRFCLCIKKQEYRDDVDDCIPVVLHAPEWQASSTIFLSPSQDLARCLIYTKGTPCGHHDDVVQGSPFKTALALQLQGVFLVDGPLLEHLWDTLPLSSQGHILPRKSPDTQQAWLESQGVVHSFLPGAVFALEEVSWS